MSKSGTCRVEEAWPRRNTGLGIMCVYDFARESVLSKYVSDYCAHSQGRAGWPAGRHSRLQDACPEETSEAWLVTEILLSPCEIRAQSNHARVKQGAAKFGQCKERTQIAVVQRSDQIRYLTYGVLVIFRTRCPAHDWPASAAPQLGCIVAFGKRECACECQNENLVEQGLTLRVLAARSPLCSVRNPRRRATKQVGTNNLLLCRKRPLGVSSHMLYTLRNPRTCTGCSSAPVLPGPVPKKLLVVRSLTERVEITLIGAVAGGFQEHVDLKHHRIFANWPTLNIVSVTRRNWPREKTTNPVEPKPSFSPSDLKSPVPAQDFSSLPAGTRPPRRPQTASRALSPIPR